MGNTTSALGTLAASRLQALRASYTTKPKKETETKDNNSIELPEAITKLNTGSDYWVKAKANRYKKLIREGHLHDLLELAKLAPRMATKADPSHWFAKVCSVKAWGRTLDFLKKLYAARHKAEQVAQRIGSSVNKFIFKQIWAQRSVDRHAATAQELRHDKPNQSSAQLFAWLCQHEGRQALA
jgi:hypothetical protein